MFRSFAGDKSYTTKMCSELQLPDIVDHVLRAFAPTQVHMDGVLSRCSLVCKTWRASVVMMTQRDKDEWYLSYVHQADLCFVDIPLQVMRLKGLTAQSTALFFDEPVATVAGDNSTSSTFSGVVENVRKMFKQTLESVVLGMTMYRRREQVQMMGIEQLSALLKMSLYDNMSVFGDAEVAILNAMRAHQGAKMQTACMGILNVMEWAGFVSQRVVRETELSMFLKAMVSHEEDASLQKHGCYVLFRVGFTLRLSLDNNKSCINAVVTALASHSDNRGVVYAGFAALVPLFWGHNHDDNPVPGIQTVLHCMQTQVTRLQSDTEVIRDAEAVYLNGHMDSVKILFAGLDLLCKLLQVDKNPFKAKDTLEYKVILVTSEAFRVARVAYCLLNQMRPALGSWHVYCDEEDKYPELIAL